MISQSVFSPSFHSTDYYATADGMRLRWESVQTFTKFDIALQFHREEALN